MYLNVHCSTTGNSQDMQATEMSINKWIKKPWYIYVHIYHNTIYVYGFPGGSDGKESACNMGNLDLISG